MKRYLPLLVLLISIITIFSGITQLVAPGFVLNIIGAQITAHTSHLFAIIGMFMALFGGMLVHAVYSSGQNGAAILWSALQKLGACIAVFIGIYNHLFSSLAAGVALFDLLSFFVIFWYYRLSKHKHLIGG